MLGLEGMGDVDAADREASFRLPAQRPADLPNGTEMRPAQVLVGAEPLPRPGEIEPGEDERGERKHPGQDRPAEDRKSKRQKSSNKCASRMTTSDRKKKKKSNH